MPYEPLTGEELDALALTADALNPQVAARIAALEEEVARLLGLVTACRRDHQDRKPPRWGGRTLQEWEAEVERQRHRAEVAEGRLFELWEELDLFREKAKEEE